MDKKEYNRQYYLANKEKLLQNQKDYYVKMKENNDFMTKRFNYRNNTLNGRAKMLLHGYKKEDLKNNRGECTLTAEWIIDNIFTKPCAHCGKTGWKVIGCNRLDNSKPHTPDNVEPCCKECNSKAYAQNKERDKKGKFTKIKGA